MKHPVHRKHHGDEAPLGIRAANAVLNRIGTWRFIIVQSILLVLWMALNVVGWAAHWDVYPFILLNLFLSFQAAFVGPIVLLAQNVSSQRDRDLWEHDYQTDQDAHALLMKIDRRLDAQQQTLDNILEVQAVRRANRKE